QDMPAAAVDNRGHGRQEIALEDREGDRIQTELSASKRRACPADAEVPGRDLVDEPTEGAIERRAAHNVGNYCTTGPASSAPRSRDRSLQSLLFERPCWDVRSRLQTGRGHS